MILTRLINICQNAADAMIDGGKLSIEWIFDRDTLEIEIQDTGSGLTEEQLQKLNSGISISSSKKTSTQLITKKIIKFTYINFFNFR